MHTNELLRSYIALPIEARKQVDELIAYLQSQQPITETAEALAEIDLSNEPFIGLWHDREDMVTAH